MPTGFAVTVNPTTLPTGADVKGMAAGTNANGHLTKNSDGSIMMLKAVIDAIHQTTFKSGDPQGFTIPTSTAPPLLAGKYTVSVSLVEIGESLPDPQPTEITLTGTEVEINDTSANNDDIVRLTKTVSGRARVTGNPPNNVSIVLTNPDGRLRFGTAATQALTLPKNGAWVAFMVTGQAGSVAANDAVIEVHKDSAGGNSLGNRTLSVWQLTDASITATPGGAYIVLNFISATQVQHQLLPSI